MPGSTTRTWASSTSAGTRPRTASSAGKTSRGTGRPATWITSSTSSAARPRSSPSGSACRSTPSPTSASRSSRTRRVGARPCTPWPPGMGRRSRPWAWGCRSRRRRARAGARSSGTLSLIEVDFAHRKGLPGFLSEESRTGDGVKYTGARGHPRDHRRPARGSPAPRSLYSLGVAYTIAPDEVERFLAANWPVISTLLTDHGPWEGYNVARSDPIRFQTTAHTLSLILGLIGTGPANMWRRTPSTPASPTASKPSSAPAPACQPSSASTPRSSPGPTRTGQIRSGREGGAFHVEGDRISLLGIAFVPKGQGGREPLGRRAPRRLSLSPAD